MLTCVKAIKNVTNSPGRSWYSINMNSGADNLNQSSDFSVQEASTLVEKHDGSRNTPICVNEQLDQCLAYACMHGMLKSMKPWGSVESIIPRKHAHRLTLGEFDTSVPLSVDTRGLEARNTENIPAEFGSTKIESESVSMPEPNTNDVTMEKFNTPLTKIEQEQLKLYALPNPRDKTIHRMMKKLISLTEKLAANNGTPLPSVSKEIKQEVSGIRKPLLLSLS